MVTVTLLGTRGSVPVSGGRFLKYGGATSCVAVEADTKCILFDAGTGILNFSPPTDRPVHIFMSHMHVDHILGLPMFAPLFRGKVRATLHAAPRDGKSVKEQLDCLMSSPLWPVESDVFGDNLIYNSLSTSGGATVIGDTTMYFAEGNHPGGALVYRLETEGKSIVYCTDFEHGDGHTGRIAEFAQGCDLLIYDANYSPEEYPSHVGWGHSTWFEGARLGEACGARRVVMFHHSSTRTDKELEEVETKLAEQYKNCTFGKGGEVIRL